MVEDLQVIEHLGTSDHNMEEFNIVAELEVEANNVPRHCFYKADYNKIQQFLSTIAWGELFDGKNANEMWCIFKEKLNQAIHDFIPLAASNRRGNVSGSNYEVKRAIRKRNKKWKKFSETKSHMDLLSYRRARNNVVRVVVMGLVCCVCTPI